MEKPDPGDQVLVLLPIAIHGNPLQAWYCGPYSVEKKTSDVDYVINTPGQRIQSISVPHYIINMLRPYLSKANPTAYKPVANVVSVNDCTLLMIHLYELRNFTIPMFF